MGRELYDADWCRKTSQVSNRIIKENSGRWVADDVSGAMIEWE
ncbi:hypothetical protein [Marinimicrobium agarilyticum]|nr:hypothetical protein [Marinimicrobium agarilyticum]